MALQDEDDLRLLRGLLTSTPKMGGLTALDLDDGDVNASDDEDERAERMTMNVAAIMVRPGVC